MAELELNVGRPAHGGFCVARIESGEGAGRVVFVRHALPGERVRAHVTEDRGGSFCRADAVEILDPSPDRVAPPCAHAGPGRCGGCDWQHASGGAQRAIKAAVVREQFARLAGLDVDPAVEELPGGLLGWRTKTRYVLDATGRPCLRRHRSHGLEQVDACPLAVPGVGDADTLARQLPGLAEIEAVRGLDGITVLGYPATVRRGRSRSAEVLSGPARVRREADGRTYETSADGFWQVHPAAADAFVSAVAAQADPRPGDCALDLYAGAGLFTAALAERVGPTGRVLGVEGSRQAVTDAAGNLAEFPWARVVHGAVTAATVRDQSGPFDIVVLDPPREGAGREVMAAVLAARPRAAVYVACDPAALARDVGTAVGLGWRLAALRAFDSYPMTHHVECVATLCEASAG